MLGSFSAPILIPSRGILLITWETRGVVNAVLPLSPDLLRAELHHSIYQPYPLIYMYFKAILMHFLLLYAISRVFFVI